MAGRRERREQGRRLRQRHFLESTTACPCIHQPARPSSPPSLHPTDKDGNVVICGIMQHIEQAGVHSGDSACSIPPQTISEECLATIREVRLTGCSVCNRIHHTARAAGMAAGACGAGMPRREPTVPLAACSPPPLPRSGPPSWPRRSRWWASSTSSTRCRTTRCAGQREGGCACQGGQLLRSA